MRCFLMFLMLGTIGVSAQIVSKQLIGSGGLTQSNGIHKLSWSVGEPIVLLMTSEDGSVQLGNGYYPAMDMTALSIEDNALELQVKVFPNPTSQMLYVIHPEFNSFTIGITDLNGKQMYNGTIQKGTPIDVSNYAQGMYLIAIKNEASKQTNTYKIIKR